MASFGISSVEASGSATSELVHQAILERLKQWG
jgi:hypothetical protein